MFDHIQDDGVSAVGVVVISACGDGGRYQDQHRPGRHHGLGGLEAGAGGEAHVVRNVVTALLTLNYRVSQLNTSEGREN